MYVSVNKELTSFRNYFGILSRLYQGKGKKRFFIKSVSADNITLRCGQRGLRGPEVEIYRVNNARAHTHIHTHTVYNTWYMNK
jgi:hypothetical protein